MSSADELQTRRSLHAVAELLLAGPQYRTSGTIKLRVCPGGFRTWSEPDLRVDGAALVAGDTRLELNDATAADLGSVVGVVPGEPEGIYSDGSKAALQDRLQIDPVIAQRLARCYEIGDAALRRLEPGAEPVLWPEHFDVGITVGGVSFGVSPGDMFMNEPYAYVSVSDRPAGEFWNAPFGAARTMRELAELDPVVRFFETGRDQYATRSSP